MLVCLFSFRYEALTAIIRSRRTVLRHQEVWESKSGTLQNGDKKTWIVFFGDTTRALGIIVCQYSTTLDTSRCWTWERKKELKLKYHTPGSETPPWLIASKGDLSSAPWTCFSGSLEISTFETGTKNSAVADGAIVSNDFQVLSDSDIEKEQSKGVDRSFVYELVKVR